MADHVLVSKTAYRSEDPRRGERVVFKTTGIEHPHISEHTFLHCHIVALPGEAISIDPPYILPDGRRVTGPNIVAMIFQKRMGMTAII